MRGAAGRVVPLCIALLSGGCARVVKTRPALSPDERRERAEERKRLASVAASSMALQCDLLLQDMVNQPGKVLELTNDLGRTYPGIEGVAAYSFVIYQRLRAAYLMCTDEHGGIEQAAKMLPVIEGCWRTLKEAKEFKYLANACKMAAYAHATAARRLEEHARKAAGGRQAGALEKQARALRDRGLDLYIELLDIAPKQTLRTYLYVLCLLHERIRQQPTDADRSKSLELLRKAIDLGLFDKDAKELHDSLKRLAPER